MVPDPDNWLSTGTVSAGGGGPIFLGKSKAEGGHCVNPQTY